jgi:hypothetical protein
MMGFDQAGLTETIQFALKKFEAEEQNRMAQVMIQYFISGNFPRSLSF